MWRSLPCDAFFWSRLVWEFWLSREPAPCWRADRIIVRRLSITVTITVTAAHLTLHCGPRAITTVTSPITRTTGGSRPIPCTPRPFMGFIRNRASVSRAATSRSGSSARYELNCHGEHRGKTRIAPASVFSVCSVAISFFGERLNAGSIDAIRRCCVFGRLVASPTTASTLAGRWPVAAGLAGRQCLPSHSIARGSSIRKSQPCRIDR